MMIYRSVQIVFVASAMIVVSAGFSGLTGMALSGDSGTAHAASLFVKPYPAAAGKVSIMHATSSSDYAGVNVRASARTRDEAAVRLIAEDCASVGQKVAASQGGTLTKATSAVQNGTPVCVVVVLVPGRAGERPRRVEVAVPAK